MIDTGRGEWIQAKKAYNPYPQMDIPFDISPSSYSSIVRIKILFCTSAPSEMEEARTPYLDVCAVGN